MHCCVSKSVGETYSMAAVRSRVKTTKVGMRAQKGCSAPCKGLPGSPLCRSGHRNGHPLLCAVKQYPCGFRNDRAQNMPEVHRQM